ncbi:hypothetical protein VSO92_12440 [Myroides pelagicus]|nr:hypothetical protein [Myroides pelagicus]
MIEFINIKDTQQSLGEWCKLVRKRVKLTQNNLATELVLSLSLFLN